MRVMMNYGRAGLEVDLADAWDVSIIRKNAMPVLADPDAAIRQALANPVNSLPLEQVGANCPRPARDLRACILICDITRPVPNGLILPAVVRTLMAAGVGPQHITVLIATGLHRPNEGDELREVVGSDWVLQTVRVANHFARNDDDHVDLGSSSAGIPVRLDRRFVEADLRLVIGLVEPHFMAGYSGGRKLIIPGVAHADTITTFHRASILAHPQAANCVLEGNPVHQQQLEIVRKIGGVLAINTVIDEHRRLAMVNFGDIEQSHLAAVDFVHRSAVVPVPRRFKTILTSAAGYPLDKTYYQTVKAMVGPMDILEPGGNLFVVSECSEGFGSPEYTAAQRRLLAAGPQRFESEVLASPRAAIDEWQTQMQLKAAARGQMHLFSTGLSPESHALTGTIRVTDLRQALRQSIENSGDPAIAVLPEGPYVVPTWQRNRR